MGGWMGGWVDGNSNALVSKMDSGWAGISEWCGGEPDG